MANEIGIYSSMGGEFGDLGFMKNSTRRYLPRFRLFTLKSGAVANGLTELGFSLVEGEEYNFLGKDVDVFPFAIRPLALDTKVQPKPMFSHDVNSDVFKDIAERAQTKDSGCLCGPEFLIWVPSAGTFATYLMGSPTDRYVWPRLKALLGRPALIKTKLIKKAQFQWHGPDVLASSSVFDMPSVEDVTAEVEKFKAAVTSPQGQPQVTEEAPASKRAR